MEKSANSSDVGFVVWLTGLPCSGKSTIASALREELERRGRKIEILDGDEIRSRIRNDRFSEQDREMHVRTVGLMAELLERNGVGVIAALVSPSRSIRDAVRSGCRRFYEIYLSTPVEECERRDVKGMYRRARAGEISGFTGVDSPYETPDAPELTLDTSRCAVTECVRSILRVLESTGGN